MFTFSRDGLREIDRRAVAEYGIPVLVLMENAGRAVAEEVKRGLKGRVLIVCGAGNNGGDGLVAARHLANAGVAVEVLLLGGREEFKHAAALQLAIVDKMGVPCEPAVKEAVRDWLVEGTEADVIVDALFGTGLSRNVDGVARQVIEAMNRSGRRIVSVDIPSGLDADSGAVLGAAVEATVTVSFCGGKLGFTKGAFQVGKCVVADIGVPINLLRELAEKVT